MECPNCKKKIGLKLKFCPYCGKMLSKERFKGKRKIYWANENGHIFHDPNCEWAKELNQSFMVVYHSRQAAIDDGKRPCSICKP